MQRGIASLIPPSTLTEVHLLTCKNLALVRSMSAGTLARYALVISPSTTAVYSRLPDSRIA